jgi:REP element-mobilizing transposase RayT
MRNPLRRYYGWGDFHFVTFSCYRRRPFLGTRRARDRFVKILDEVRARHPFEIVGYVVMPEHVHLLIGEPRKGNPSTVLQVLKQKISRALRRRPRRPASGQLALAFPGEEGEAAAFWQRRFYDFNVWSEEGERKTGVYACESRAKKIGESSEGLAVEQLGVLCEGRRGVAANRHPRREETRNKSSFGAEEKSKTAPLEPKGAHPPPRP